MSLKLSTNIDDKDKINDPENLIKCGIDTIYKTFTTNIGNYVEQITEQKRIINELTKKLELMKEEMEMIQRENKYYKTQNEQLKNEIENLNKIVNNIKGKLNIFDFKLNNKKIINNINQDNIYKNNFIIKKQPTEITNFKNNHFKNDMYTIKYTKYENYNNFNREKPLKNYEINKSSNTIRYDNKQFKIDTANESDINNIDNNIDIEQELNIDNFKKNFNIDNKNNYINENRNININQNKSHSIYTHFKNKRIEPNSSNIINSHSQRNTINIKLNNNKNFNRGNKIKRYTNSSFGIPLAIKLEKKNNNINFNNNKNEIFLQKKINKKNKIRSNSSNNVIKRENNQYEVQNLTNRNNIKENSFPFLNQITLIQGSDNNDYKDQICQTFQNINNSQKIINNYNLNENNSIIKEIKIKEMTLFLKKCKISLDEITFNKIVKLFQDYKNRVINDEVIIIKINQYLKNNDELLNLFKTIIS